VLISVGNMSNQSDVGREVLAIARAPSERLSGSTALKPWLDNWIFRDCYRERFFGLLLIVVKPEHRDESIEKLRAALTLIRDTDRKRLARARSDVRFIVVTDLPQSPATWSLPFKAVALDTAALRRVPISLLAVILVHEFTHARLWHAGIRHWKRARARVEQACTKQHLRFASQLPSREAFTEDLENFLNAEHAIAETSDRNLEYLRGGGIPAWIARPLLVTSEVVYGFVVLAADTLWKITAVFRSSKSA